MGNGIDSLRGGSHLLNALGLDPFGLTQQLEQLQELQLLQELRDSFQLTCGGMNPNMLATMLQNGGIAAPCSIPPPNVSACGCGHNYAAPQTFDFGAQPGVHGVGGMYRRMQGAMFERFLGANPFARQQFEMAMGGRILPDGLQDGRISIQPFSNGFFPAGGAGSPFASAASMFAGMARAQMMAGMPGAASQSMFQGMMLNGLSNVFGSMFGGGGGGGGIPRGPGGGSPFVDWFGDPFAQQRAQQGGFGQNPFGQFQPGGFGPTQGEFGLSPNDGSDVSGVLNDSSLTVEDKVTLMLMLIMKKMDQDIEKQAQDINKLQQQQNKQGGGGKGKGGGGGGGGDKSIDVETMKLKRLIDKRSQMFDMLRQIIDKYNQTAKGVIDAITR